MKLSEHIKQFFISWEEIWGAIPGYIKIFAYSTLSVLIGMYIADAKIDFKTIVTIVATNIGLYQVPRVGTKQIKNLL